MADDVDVDPADFLFHEVPPAAFDVDDEGRPILTIVDRTGIHHIGVAWCRCPNADTPDMQLFNLGLFPATFQQPRTAFTFDVLDDFLIENLECKTTAFQFSSKLRRTTSREFPDSAPVGVLVVAWQVSDKHSAEPLPRASSHFAAVQGYAELSAAWLRV